MASLRIRLSNREQATLRIALRRRVRLQTERLSESYGEEYNHNEELLAHFKKLLKRLGDTDV